jgi:hypothetical protein
MWTLARSRALAAAPPKISACSMPADAANLVRHLMSLLAGWLTHHQRAAPSGATHHERHMIFSVDSRAPAAG